VRLKLIDFPKSLLLSILMLVALLQPTVFAQGIKGVLVEPDSHHPPSTEELRRLVQITGMVLSSTPLNKKREFKGHDRNDTSKDLAALRSEYPTSVVKFHHEDSGLVSELRLEQASKWLDQDFYTLWAVASFPPVKPYSARMLGSAMSICNSPGQARDTTNAESAIRQAIANSLSQVNLGEKRVAFTLIPGAFIEVFPGVFQLSDICGKENLVSISLESLQQNSVCWTKYGAAEVLKSTNTISALLDEWPTFFRQNSHPSRSSILAFASHLREKYKALFTT
jgi:hypothetical protein